MKRSFAVLLAGTALLGAYACGNRAPSRDLPATFVWGKDQSCIDPASGRMNVWGGFEVRDGTFSAEKNMARFILWRTAGLDARITIEYVLRGKPCRFLVNGAAAGELAPSTRPVSTTFGARLNAGFNFLEFDKKTNDVLRIRSVLAGPREDRPRRQLGEGESLTLGTGLAKGRLVFAGSGTLRITEVSFHEGREIVRTFERKPGLFSRRIAYEYNDPSPGYATFLAKSGSFDIVERSVVPARDTPAAGTPKFAGRPDIFIFLIDACRPDHLGLYGYARPTSPNLDRFAEDAVVFESAYANASFTRSSVATLFTGLYPEGHKVRILMNKLSERLLTIPVYLKAKGYRTSLFTATGNVSENMGFARGVDDYFPHIGEWRRGVERTVPSEYEGWLAHEGPLFGYIHFMEPHLPVVPPPPFLDMFSAPEDRAFVHGVLEEFQRKIDADRPFGPKEVKAVVDNYDSAVAYIDGEVGKLLKSLKDRGSYDESLIIVLSDHGESLYEREFWGHGAKVYEETTRVPLLVKFPAGMGLKGRVKGIVELAGAFPTLLDLFGQSVGLEGKSWLPAVAARDEDDAMSVSRSFSNVGDFGLRWRDWYAIINLAAGTEALYRRAEPVFAEAGAGTENVRLLFKVRFLDWLGRFAELDDRPVPVDLRTLPKNELENLRSLGYIK
ncbi:MAG TPA: sulfatase [Acidobacteriota bacterium]|nr:sulfatase [Acidobacteriota bacterium]